MKEKLFGFGLILMLFIGLIYAWSIFTAPLELAFDWTRSHRSASFYISMFSFCLGALACGYLLNYQPLSRVLVVFGFLFFIIFYWALIITKIHELYLSFGLIYGYGPGQPSIWQPNWDDGWLARHGSEF